MKTVYGRFANLSLTSAQWAAITEPLKEGEIGYDTTLDKVKVGDGTSLWVDLPFEAETSVDTGLTCNDFSI